MWLLLLVAAHLLLVLLVLLLVCVGLLRCGARESVSTMDWRVQDHGDLQG